MSEPTDDLADVLAPLPVATPDPARREATLRATTGVLARRRWLRRGLGGVCVLGVFAAGAAFGWVAKPTPPAEVVISSPEQTLAPPPVATPPAPPDPLTAERLELLAELADRPNEAARLYRQAGDTFLTARDYENAARCYRRHLNAADADDRKLSSSDSWMLQTMKVPTR